MRAFVWFSSCLALTLVELVSQAYDEVLEVPEAQGTNYISENHLKFPYASSQASLKLNSIQIHLKIYSGKLPRNKGSPIGLDERLGLLSAEENYQSRHHTSEFIL
jgi:hypothetical protein